MKKIIFSIIAIFILLFVILNYRYVFYNYNNILWNIEYDNLNFSWALDYHHKALENEKTSKILHNIWNDYFRLWDLMTNVSDKLSDYHQAEENYVSSLLLEEDEETRFNLDLVREKIKNLENKNENKENKEEDEKGEGDIWENNSEENKSNENSSSENSDSNQNKASNDGSEDSNNWEVMKQERWEQYKLWWEDKTSNLTGEEKEFLKQYEDFLKSEEKNNQMFFNKKQSQNRSNLDSFYDIFWNEINFDNNFGSEEKDW